MTLNMYKKIALVCFGLSVISLFAMKEEEESSEEKFVVFPPEVFENIRKYSDKEARHRLETAGKFFYQLGKRDREAEIVQKAKIAALVSLYRNNIKRKSKEKFESIHPDFVTLYKQSYAHYLFYFGSWVNFFQAKTMFILPHWKLVYSEKFSKNLPQCESISIVIKRKREKTIFQTMVLCPAEFSVENFAELVKQSFTQPSIRKIVLQDQTLFNTKEKIAAIITYLEQYGFKGIITINVHNLTVIATCCRGQITLSEDQFKFFLESNNLYATIPYGYKSPLILLCQANILLPPKFTELLLEYGADPNMHDNEALVPLHYLCFRSTSDEIEEERRKNIITILLQKGADPNMQDQKLWTPLHFLCTKEILPLDLIELLLQYGANPNLQNKALFSPLHSICYIENPSIELIKLLLQYGANPYLKDKFGKTPFDYIQNEDLKQQVIEYYESL